MAQTKEPGVITPEMRVVMENIGARLEEFVAKNQHKLDTYDELVKALEKIHARADGGSTWTDIAYIARTALAKVKQ